MEPGVHLRASEVGPLAVHSFQNTGRNQVGNRLPYGHPANAEADHEGALGGDGGARVQFARDQVLQDAADLSAFGRCRGGLAIKPETAEIIPDMLLLQCVLTAPIRSGRQDRPQAARDARCSEASMRSYPGGRQPGTSFS